MNDVINDRAVTVRVAPDQFEMLTKLAAENRQTVSAMVGGMVDACASIIEAKGTVEMPKFLALCRLSKNYGTQTKDTINEPSPRH